MKKLIMLAALACLAFVGCSKDDDGNSLSGTTWKYEETDYWSILNFTSDTQVTWSWQEFDDLSGTDNCTYTYDPPVVRIYIPGEETVVGTINGNQLIFEDSDFVFIKQ